MRNLLWSYNKLSKFLAFSIYLFFHFLLVFVDYSILSQISRRLWTKCRIGTVDTTEIRWLQGWRAFHGRRRGKGEITTSHFGPRVWLYFSLTTRTYLAGKEWLCFASGVKEFWNVLLFMKVSFIKEWRGKMLKLIWNDVEENMTWCCPKK